MPMYRTPPSTPPSSPPPSRSPSRSRSRTQSMANSSSRDRSYSRSPSAHSRSSKLSRVSSIVTPASKESALKTSLVFLGGVAAATFAAHKFWPKGITYGEKEDWEIEKAHKKVKKELREEKARARKEVPDRRAEYGYPAREERRARYRDAGGRGERMAGGGYVAHEEVYERVVPRRGGSRERGMSRDRGGPERDRDRDRYSQGSNSRPSSRDRGGDVMVERHTTRQESRYYPPAPQRYRIEPTPPPPRPRRPSVNRGQQRRTWDDDPPKQEREPVYVTRGPPPEPQARRGGPERGVARKYYDDEPEVVYVSRPAPEPRSRRASVDAGPRRRYEDDDY